MQLIPSVPHRTNSTAELRVFDRLRTAFSDTLELELTAYHSLNLTRHAYKRFGEIDFLIVGRPGIFVLEVKGGRIGCSNGIWTYKNRAGDESRSPEGPFRQAELALHGLMDRLRSTLPTPVWAGFTIGYGVIFPDCEWKTSSAEWEPQMLADAKGARNLEGWISGLFDHWQRRDTRRHPPPDSTALTRVKQWLRPEVEVAVPLYVQTSAVGERISALTADQMRMVDVADANPRVICSGGAGTGKTFLALELARRWTALGLKVVLTCRSRWLKRYLDGQAALPGLAVSVADAVGLAADRIGIACFDALIVDEGQDLLNMTALERLDSVLENGLSRGRWCFFHDINNQSGLFGAADPDALRLLEDCTPARVPLTTNCRNTHRILAKVQSTLGADMGVRGAGEGPAVMEKIVTSPRQSARVLAAELDRIIGRGGLLPGEVSILSPKPFAASSAALLPSGLLDRIVVLDEYSLRQFPPDRISFAEIGQFKGLENEAVIVIDLAALSAGFSPTLDYYVGMSRPRAVLSLIFQPKKSGQPLAISC